MQKSFTTRPQDLEELVEFWNKEHRIGTRLELMLNSVQRRLRERDEVIARLSHSPRRVHARGRGCSPRPRFWERSQAIQVPDGSHNHKGIAVQLVLPDWDDRDQQTLLSRPMSMKAIFAEPCGFTTARFANLGSPELARAAASASASRREVERSCFGNGTVWKSSSTDAAVLPGLQVFDERVATRSPRSHPNPVRGW